MQTVQLYYSGAVGNANASVNMPRSGKIVGVQFAAGGDFDADTEYLTLALETVPTLQANTNAAQGTIAVLRWVNALTTSGNALSSACGYFPVPSLGVDAGQLIYANSAGTSLNHTITWLIYLQ